MPKKGYRKRPNERQLKVVAHLATNGGSLRQAIIAAGYSDEIARNPNKLLKGKSFEELRDKFLPDHKVLATHAKLLNAHRLEHMVFPLGPESKQEAEDDDLDEETIIASGETVDLTDTEITEMLAEVNCTVRKIVHGEQARHVYFWSADNKAQQAATELAYKIKNKIPQASGSQVVVPVQVNIGDDRKEFA